MNPDKIENSLLTGTEPDKHACPLCGRNLSEAEDIYILVYDKRGDKFRRVSMCECACGYSFMEE